MDTVKSETDAAKRKIYDKILKKIEEYGTILIFRHKRPDGDCAGSSFALREILKLTYPEKEVYLQNDDFSERLAFLGKEDEILPDEKYKNALGIVLDTGTSGRIANEKYKLCAEIIKIDHHIPVDSYGDTEWVEEEKSSVCEMIAELYLACSDRLKINKYAAECLYTGMVTDSGRFRYSSVTGETLITAGRIMSVGVDTEKLYSRLYSEDFDMLKFRAYVYGKMRMSEHGVLSVYVGAGAQKKFRLTSERAGDAVSYLDSVKGALIWIAFIRNGDGSIRARLRSGHVAVDGLAAKYRGGGHKNASGATVYGMKEMRALIRDADEIAAKNAKSENTDP